MSNLNEHEQNFEHLIPNKLLKRSAILVEKYYSSAELSILNIDNNEDIL